MYINNIVNFQESTTILNACAKESGNLFRVPPIFICICMIGQIKNKQTAIKEYYVEVLREFKKRFLWKRPTLFKSGQWHFHPDNAPVLNSILVTDYLMGIKTVPQPPDSPDLALCDFWLFPKLRGCRYETIEEIKEAATNAIDTLTQEDFHEAFQMLLERYNKCIAAGGDYFQVD